MAGQSYALFPPSNAVVVGLRNSECSQQKRANENKHGAYRQHIETQGNVIGLDDSKHSKLPSGRRKTAPAGSRGRSRIGTRTVHAASGTEAQAVRTHSEDRLQKRCARWGAESRKM